MAEQFRNSLDIHAVLTDVLLTKHLDLDFEPLIFQQGLDIHGLVRLLYSRGLFEDKHFILALYRQRCLESKLCDISLESELQIPVISEPYSHSVPSLDWG